MRKLELVGLTDDGRWVVLADDAGDEFLTPADDRLLAALRGDRARIGQLEIQMDSVLRPRDIQARIRSGETPEAVASVAQVSVERILPYCVPVLAERQHIAEIARRSHLRRKNADGPARRLVDVVTERLRSRGVDPSSVEWDAWRREDGRWAVQSSYHSGERERTAMFVFDLIGRYSAADDDEAKWLTGERQSTRKGPQPRESGHGGERRLTAVPDGSDLLSLPDDESEDDDANDDLTAVVRAISDQETPPTVRVDADSRSGSDVGDDSTETSTTISEERPSDLSLPPGQPDGPAPVQAVEPDDVEPLTEPTPERKRRGPRRASVPSWDEIMLGGGGSGAGSQDNGQ